MNGRRIMDKSLVMIQLAESLRTLSAGALRQVGAVVFDPWFQHVLAIGYNGPFAGRPHEESGKDPDRPSGDAHAEVNALIKLNTQRWSGRKAIMAVTCPPCQTCAGYIINSNAIGLVLSGRENASYAGLMMLGKAGIRWAAYHKPNGDFDMGIVNQIVQMRMQKAS